jgi:hypothetical protein
MTLAEKLSNASDEILVNIELELSTALIPASGYARRYCREVNNLIDRGEMCINPTTFRKVYLPTLAKAIQRELATRYVNSIVSGQLEI